MAGVLHASCGDVEGMSLAGISAPEEGVLPCQLLPQKSGADKAAADAQSESTAELSGFIESTDDSSIEGLSCCDFLRERPRLIRNVAIHDPHMNEMMAALIIQARGLSQLVFQEDCLQEITKKSAWKLSILASDDLAVFCGFVVSKVAKGSLSIAKIAVPAHFRGQGFGKFIMEELMKTARKQGDVYEVCLSSLDTAVTFYRRLGFKAVTGLKLGSQEDLVEGQVYMEKKLRRRRR